MRPLIPLGDRFAVILVLSFFLGIGLLSAPSPVAAQAQYIVQPVAEMKVKQLPKGELFWRVESFPTLEQAKAAAPPYRWNPDTVSYDGLPSLTAEVAGKAWLFTLGPKGGATAGGTKVAEIGGAATERLVFQCSRGRCRIHRDVGSTFSHHIDSRRWASLRGPRHRQGILRVGPADNAVLASGPAMNQHRGPPW